MPMNSEWKERFSLESVQSCSRHQANEQLEQNKNPVEGCVENYVYFGGWYKSEASTLIW